MAENQIVLFQSSDGVVSLPVQLESESVWLTQAQMAQLFGKDRTVIGRHIRNAIEEGEINAKTMCAKMATELYHTDIYSLDVIISVGYRVHSLRGVEFRRWATSVLKEYVLRGYAINRKRLAQLGQAVEVMKRVSNSLDTEQVLDVVKSYSAALDLLDGYDHQTVGKPSTKARSVELTYAECRAFIDDMKFAGSSVLFGNEKDGSFKSALGAVYQSFGGRDLYPSAQEKSANLLYLVTRTTDSPTATNVSPPDFSFTSSSATSCFCARTEPSASPITRLLPSPS